MSPHPGVECVLYPSIFSSVSILISAECRVELATRVRADVIITEEATTLVYLPCLGAGLALSTRRRP